jgi:hypothetical protein
VRRRDAAKRHQLWITGGCAIAAAVLGALVTGGFGLLATGHASSTDRTISASGGRSSNTNVCIGSGAYVQGTVNCAIPDSSARDTKGVGTSTSLVSYSSAPVRSECGLPTFLPQPIVKQVLSRLGPSSWRTIEDQPGAAPAGQTTVEASIQGESARVITITGISFKVHRMKRPKGAIVDEACGGPLEGRSVVVALDSSPPKILGTNSNRHGWLAPPGENASVLTLQVSNRPRPITFPWTVSVTDPLQLYLFAMAKSCYCGWQAEIPWVSGAWRGIISISNHGRDYPVVGGSGLHTYQWATTRWTQVND